MHKDKLNQQKAVMSFKLENFAAAASMELLNLAKKTDLVNIADHYALVDEEIFDPSALSSILITQTG